MDVFELSEQGFVMESLTTGHGMTGVNDSACWCGRSEGQGWCMPACRR
jgi:hypothetical protein